MNNYIENMVDDGSFIRLSNTFDDRIEIGYATINSKLVYFIIENDNTINKEELVKISKIYELAMAVGAPIIYIIDNNGVDLNDSLSNMYLYGDIFKLQSRASGMILQIAIVKGKCGGGMATVASLCDFLFIDEENGKLFSIPPITILDNKNNDYANAKNIKDSLLIDGIYKKENLYSKVRDLIDILPSNFLDNDSYDECNDDINRKMKNNFESATTDFIKELSDNNMFFEIKNEYAKGILTAFIKLNGQTIGVIANKNEEGHLCKNAIKKAKKFISFLDSFSIPLLTITNVKRFNVKNNDEQDISILSSELCYAYVNSTIPKVTIIKNAIGVSGIVMGSKSLNVDLVYAYKKSLISPMDVEILAEIRNMDKNEILKEFSTNNLIRENIVDDIIEEEDTRQILISSFEMLFTKKVDKPIKKYGVS